MEELETRVTRIEDTCMARQEVIEKASKYYPRTLAALGVAWALLWGYFEFRVYPNIAQSQADVQALRMEVYRYMIDNRMSRGTHHGEPTETDSTAHLPSRTISTGEPRGNHRMASSARYPAPRRVPLVHP